MPSLTGMGPEVVQIPMSLHHKPLLLARSTSWPIQSDVVDVHHARTTGRCAAG